VCIIVRQQEPHVAKLLKQNGCIVGYDLLDRPVSDYHANFNRGSLVGDFSWSCYADPNIDFYIVNNSLAKERLRESLISCNQDKPIHVIPHHTVNFEKIKNDTSISVKRIGYVGISNQLSRSQDIENFCKLHNVEFINVNPLTREECVNHMRSLDLGLIFIENTENIPYTLMYKPNTKLTNFLSYGIPTLAVPYQSFLEFGGNAWINIENVQHLLDNLAKLMTNFKLRQSMSFDGYKHAGNFHIDQIVQNYYIPLLERIKK
jgi:hypothetical protein